MARLCFVGLRTFLLSPLIIRITCAISAVRGLAIWPLLVLLSAASSWGQVVVWGPDACANAVPPEVTNVTAIAAGASHALALREDGTVVAWGDNSVGQTNVPFGLEQVQAVAAGDGFSLALLRDGCIVQWGFGLPTGTNFCSWLTNVTAISARGHHALALKVDGTVVPWGGSSFGEGNVPAGLTGVVAVASGDNHNLALKADGTVVAWGANTFGQLDVPTNLVQVVAIGAGGEHSLAVKADGSVVAWGKNDYGQTSVPATLTNVVGVAAGTGYSVALEADGSLVVWGELGAPVPTGLPPARAVASGPAFCLALLSPGVVSGTNLPPVLPVQATRTVDEMSELVVTNAALDPGQPVAAVSYVLLSAPASATVDGYGIIRWNPTEEHGPGSYTFTMQAANTYAGTFATNSFEVMVREVNRPPVLRTLGHYFLESAPEIVVTNTATDPDSPPNQVSYELIGAPAGATIDGYGVIRWQPSAAQIPSTNIITTVATDNGEPPLSASNWFMVCLSSPERPKVISQTHSMGVGIGRDVTLMVEAIGRAPLEYQWRFMGTNLPGATTSTFTLTNAQPWHSGSYGAIVRNAVGDAWSDLIEISVQGVVAWGWSQFHILIPPPTVTNVVALSAGKIHSLALRADGTVVAWGYNVYGESDVPAGLSNVVAVAAGNGYSLAVKADGTVVGWGVALQGELDIPAGLAEVRAIATDAGCTLALRGDGTVVGWGKQGKVPPNLTNVVAIATGGNNSLVLRADGTLAAWGIYELNTGQWKPAYVPDGLTNVVAIASARAGCFALQGDGTVVGWGFTSAGEVQVPAEATNVVAISSCVEHTLALRADGTVLQWGNLVGDVVQPPDLRNVVGIAAGGYLSLALLRDGAPHLTVQPGDQKVAKGGRSRFAAKAVGHQESMSYKWQFNGTDIEGATGDSYTITNTSPEQAGEYTLVVSNSVGTSMSRHAKLVVLPVNGCAAPALTVVPRSANQPLQMEVSGDLGPAYIIETSANLRDWTAVETNRPTAMPFLFTAPDLDASARFYRIRAEPLRPDLL